MHMNYKNLLTLTLFTGFGAFAMELPPIPLEEELGLLLSAGNEFMEEVYPPCQNAALPNPPAVIAAANNHILTSSNKLECSICKRIVTKVHLKRHMKTHSECEQCGQFFVQKTNLIRHMKTVHTNNKPFQCKECDATFSRSDGLTDHMQIHIKHMKTHSEESDKKQHQCEQCGDFFAQKGNLTRHIKTAHINNKPFQCKECDATFSRNDSLTSHTQIHIMKKKYQCLQCGQSFLKRSLLADHARTHPKRKPYLCDLCNVSFTRHDYLNKHVKSCRGEKLLFGGFFGIKKNLQINHRNQVEELKKR